MTGTNGNHTENGHKTAYTGAEQGLILELVGFVHYMRSRGFPMPKTDKDMITYLNGYILHLREEKRRHLREKEA